MAEQEQEQQQGQPQDRDRGTIGFSPTGGINKDLLDYAMRPNMYYHALNATFNLPDGGIGGFHTEPSNYLSLDRSPMVHIGSIPLVESQWILFFTANTTPGIYNAQSEIGIYDDNSETYTVLVNDSANIGTSYSLMGFNTSNPITGVSRRGYDCGFDIYWSDGGLNPDRILNTAACPWNIPGTTSPNPNNQQISPNPWIQTCVITSSCIECSNTPYVDIQQLRLAPIFSIPCLSLSKAPGSGILINGSYQVFLRYCINGLPCTDFVAASNQQSIWSHLGQGGGLLLELSNTEQTTLTHTATFTEMEIVVVSVIEQQAQAKSYGVFDTNLAQIYIDSINPSLKPIPLEILPLSNPAILTSNAIYNISDYLLRIGPSERPDFNYQPLANQIGTEWVIVQYPEAYYHLGGNNVGYLGGETYAFYIRWCYTTGDKSASYNIPAGVIPHSFNIATGTTSDGGEILAFGGMNIYTSTQTYPDNQPEIWGSLCGQPIKHHQFPDVNAFGTSITAHYTTIGENSYIRVRGVQFTNIQPPKDINGNLIPDIQGYEILRADRQGNERVIAKGMINNMIPYTDSSGTKGMFCNFPYNDLSPNRYISNNVSTINAGTPGEGLTDPLTGFLTNYLSFHSPDTVFQQPYLGTGDLQFLLGMSGTVHGIFTQPYKHPLFKVLTNFDGVLGTFISAIVPLINAINLISGGSANFTFNATEDIPMTLPIQVGPLPEGFDGVLSGILYGVITGLEITLFATMSAIQIVVLQEQILTIIKGLIPGRQYATQFNSYCFYNQNLPVYDLPYQVSDYQYILGQMQYFQGQVVNNLYRNKYVIMQTTTGTDIGIPATDTSRYLITDVGNQLNVWDTSRNAASYYASYSVNFLDQYGQVDSCKLLPIGCMQQVVPGSPNTYNSPIFFGGDTYVVRYTEKNPFLFFNDWLVDAPEDFIYDYRNYINVPYPMFWINNDVINFTLFNTPSKNRRLNGVSNTWGAATFTGPGNLFYVNTGFFYLFCNGTRDFFVETAFNMGYRDYGESLQEQFYNPYGQSDVNQLYRSDIIKYPEYYKYDYSLSANRFFNQWASWSSCLRRDYNEQLAYTCFNYYPRRLNYSLQQTQEVEKDNWRVFLPNNYVDFTSNITNVTCINNTGAMFFLDDDSPKMVTGVQFMPSKEGTEYTVGTGKLFEQALQNVVHTDRSLQHGSCQGKYAVADTPYGVFWISQRTGKIWQDAPNKTYFNQGERMVDVTTKGLKYWMALYLPCQLTSYFPNYTNDDNPVSGVGTQVFYDNTNEVVYFSKKDYAPIPGMNIIEQGGQFYNILGSTESGLRTLIQLGDPNYFLDCSWTVSYDPQKKMFISFHSWIPALTLSGEKHIITAQQGQIWKHNILTNSFCSFYGVQYPWEIEAPLNTGDQVITIENIEYILDSYNFKTNQTDKFNNYSDAFDYAQIFNKEQSTLPLLLIEKPWNNPWGSNGYPLLSSTGLSILYTKVENKFRFATIRDYTNDRGQFDLDIVQMKITNPNGVGWTVNNLYMDFYKDPTQLKKLRHRQNNILLRMTNPGPNSATLFNIKCNIIKSPR